MGRHCFQAVPIHGKGYLFMTVRIYLAIGLAIITMSLCLAGYWLLSIIPMIMLYLVVGSLIVDSDWGRKHVGPGRIRSFFTMDGLEDARNRSYTKTLDRINEMQRKRTDKWQ